MQMSARCAINNQKYLVEGLMGSCWMHSSLTAVQQFYNTDKRQLKTRGIKQQRQHTHVAYTYVTLAAISIDQKCFYVTLKKNVTLLAVYRLWWQLFPTLRVTSNHKGSWLNRNL